MNNELDPRLGLPSASSMDRTMRCPGSAIAQIGIPDEPDQAVTETGNVVHAAMAGEEYDEDQEDEATLGMTERQIVEQLQNMEAAAVQKWVEDGYSDGNHKVIREERFWIRDDKLEPVASGQPDVVYQSDRSILVLNYKTGFKDPTASELNWQCRTEVVVTWFNMPKEIVHARAGILASRLTNKLDTTDYDVEDFRRLRTEIIHAQWRSRQPDAPRVPGDHCRWCKAKAHCRENVVYGMVVASKVPIIKGPLNRSKVDDLEIIAAVNRLTPAELGFFYSRKGAVEKTLEAAKIRLMSLTEDELLQAGYKLKPGNKLGTISDDGAALSAILSILSPKEAAKCIKFVRGRAIKLIGDKADANGKFPTKDQAKELVENTLGDLLVRREGNKRLELL